MANNATTLVIRGRLDWCKLIGEPRLNTFTGEKEWSVDITPDENSLKLLKQHKLSKKLKEKDGRPDYIQFRQREYREDLKTGERIKNRPVTINDVTGKPWNGALIGNGSIGDIKFNVKDYGPGKPAGMYIQALRVLKLVPYEGGAAFEPLSEDDEFFAAGKVQNDAEPDTDFAGETSSGFDPDLDDEIPF